jgi:hypothetical protein
VIAGFVLYAAADLLLHLKFDQHDTKSFYLAGITF